MDEAEKVDVLKLTAEDLTPKGGLKERKWNWKNRAKRSFPR